MFAQGVTPAIRAATWAGLLPAILDYKAGMLARHRIGAGARDEALQEPFGSLGHPMLTMAQAATWDIFSAT